MNIKTVMNINNIVVTKTIVEDFPKRTEKKLLALHNIHIITAMNNASHAPLELVRNNPIMITDPIVHEMNALMKSRLLQ
jgi:hypothetical protein